MKWKAWKSYSDNKCTKSWSSGYNEATLISYRDGFVCAPPKEMINGVCQEQEDCAASKGMTETIDYFPSQLGGYPGNYCGKDNCAMAPVSTTCNGATGSDEQCTGVYEYTGAECAHDPIAPDTNVDIGDKPPGADNYCDTPKYTQDKAQAEAMCIANAPEGASVKFSATCNREQERMETVCEYDKPVEPPIDPPVDPPVDPPTDPELPTRPVKVVALTLTLRSSLTASVTRPWPTTQIVLTQARALAALVVMAQPLTPNRGQTCRVLHNNWRR